MHKQLLYVVKKTKILNRENHSNEVYTRTAVLSLRAGSRPKQPATGQSLAGYFRLALLLILVRNLK